MSGVNFQQEMYGSYSEDGASQFSVYIRSYVWYLKWADSWFFTLRMNPGFCVISASLNGYCVCADFSLANENCVVQSTGSSLFFCNHITTEKALQAFHMLHYSIKSLSAEDDSCLAFHACVIFTGLTRHAWFRSHKVAELPYYIQRRPDNYDTDSATLGF